jgi:DNA repair protein RecO (recombination protein O)
MLQKMNGIVIHSLKYNDSSLIVDIYTDLHGRGAFLVPLPRSRKAAVKSVLFQPLAMVEIEADIRPGGRGLTRVREAKAAMPFKSIPYDAVKSAIALFIAEFLYRALREEEANAPLFAYLVNSLEWLDECESKYANFHLVFLMRMSRFLGFYPNLDDYRDGDLFDLQNAVFVGKAPVTHHYYIDAEETRAFRQLMRLNYETMGLFAMNRQQRQRCLAIVMDYYRLHLPDFPQLKSLDILQELFD